MATLEDCDLRRLLHVVNALQTPRTFEEFPHVVMHLVGQLVSTQYTAYNEVDLRRGRVIGFINPSELSVPELAARLEPFLDEHPLIAHAQASGSGAAIKISDLLSTREFHRTAIYNEFFRPLAIRDQMSLSFASPEGNLIAVVLNQTQRNFSTRERRLFEYLRPHVQQAYANAHAFSRLQNIIAAQGGLWEQMAAGVILLCPDGSIAFRSAQAMHWLRDYFGADGDKAVLPAKLRDWVLARHAAFRAGQSVLPATPLVIARGAKTLSVRHLSETLGYDVLLMDESTRIAPLEALRALGLTSRQAEVLLWMARGESNAQIAVRLHISPHTIKRHSEAIFDRLEVPHRHAATDRARQAMGQCAPTLVPKNDSL